MSASPKPIPAAQLLEAKRRSSRKRGARLSPRNLTRLTRSLLIDEFIACGDADQVAKKHQLPIRTLDSILFWAALVGRPQLGSAAIPLRREVAA